MSFPPLAVLAHAERRRIASELSKTDDPVDVTIVSSSPAGGGVQSEILHDVLYFHLPKMAEYGYVTFDRPARTVSRGPRFDALRPYLGSTNGHRPATDIE